MRRPTPAWRLACSAQPARPPCDYLDGQILNEWRAGARRVSVSSSS
ncbi:TPA: hypothetical protein QDB19_003776 [Burkholderia vietnamiensis]|nr:hypothetical protein [Burkholderia vietnamiensis]